MPDIGVLKQVEQDNIHMISVSNASVPSGGGSDYELIVSKEYNISTLSTTQQAIDTIIPSQNIQTADKIVYVKIRDKAGKRNGYFYGSDQWFINLPAANGLQSLVAYAPRIIYGCKSTGKWDGATTGTFYPASSASAAGVIASVITGGGNINITARYSQNVSYTIDGTFVVEVYYLKWPNNVSPIA